ncbi:hypothetical protein Vadar_034207 [Vaccinium darrowii]|uniref:Uncharacterized protein n=1 Tax=Vaccinium darrowii TaxID=229202 RepID=A0ACB7YSV1_9ERIC|nr:hypothetical protein Vadar_034207 [Vaccinium darrowii]
MLLWFSLLHPHVLPTQSAAFGLLCCFWFILRHPHLLILATPILALLNFGRKCYVMNTRCCTVRALFNPISLVSGRMRRTLYVGNLPPNIRERDVLHIFRECGRIAHIDLKTSPRHPSYAFVKFEEARDAENAINGHDVYKFAGYRLRVEFARGGHGSSALDHYSVYKRGGGHGRVSRRSEYQVLVTGLPSSASWQDLKVSYPLSMVPLMTLTGLGLYYLDFPMVRLVDSSAYGFSLIFVFPVKN